LGTHLAVIDDLGTITIWEQDNYAAQLVPRQTFPNEGNNDVGNRIVSIRWLHCDTKIHLALKLAKNGDQWHCQGNSQRGYGPCNVVGKEAFVAVTSDARVPTLLY